MGEKGIKLGKNPGLKSDEISTKSNSTGKSEETIPSNYVFDLNQPIITIECDTNTLVSDDGQNISKTGYIGEEGGSKSLEDDEGDKLKRKKMNLSTEQVTLLEDVFKCHDVPSKKQKLDLAEVLNITPKQVQVWFQNRRATRKTKNTEVDVERLKISLEALKEENFRLKRELDNLRVANFSNHTNSNPTTTALVLGLGCNNVMIPTTLSSTTTISTLNSFKCDIKQHDDIAPSSSSKKY